MITQSGAPTFELLCAAYYKVTGINQISKSSISMYYCYGRSSAEANRWFNLKGVWWAGEDSYIAAPNANDTTNIWRISNLKEDGDFASLSVNDANGSWAKGFRVVVKLNDSARIVEKNGIYQVIAGDGQSK